MLWNLAARITISRPLGDTGGSRSIMFSPDGTILFTGSEDGKVFLQDARSGKPLGTLDTTRYPLLKPKHANDENLLAIASLALSRDGSILATGRSDGSIILWNLKSETPLALFRYP